MIYAVGWRVLIPTSERALHGPLPLKMVWLVRCHLALTIQMAPSRDRGQWNGSSGLAASGFIGAEIAIG